MVNVRPRMKVLLELDLILKHMGCASCMFDFIRRLLSSAWHTLAAH